MLAERMVDLAAGKLRPDLILPQGMAAELCVKTVRMYGISRAGARVRGCDRSEARYRF